MDVTVRASSTDEVACSLKACNCSPTLDQHTDDLDALLAQSVLWTPASQLGDESSWDEVFSVRPRKPHKSLFAPHCQRIGLTLASGHVQSVQVWILLCVFMYGAH